MDASMALAFVGGIVVGIIGGIVIAFFFEMFKDS